ncbi:hypothetical protein DFA_07758 [Cavenderia fasciculata]|uniref:Ankyrin repeat-containing protein n=1 Tax=Cavenderia fasciculata TaxID=261658 RepID=F4Q358_CACFS|nr:uncharacterized protein DFA_07758 [Cavenderia fasciculata]EGG16780.1 hypothetical protein DFA_07758 [Cavenderia fasciculata]|eukprot:XP_004355254.1 hypothetical protein DFA_07758 [Cavenderia fasciculata]
MQDISNSNNNNFEKDRIFKFIINNKILRRLIINHVDEISKFTSGHLSIKTGLEITSSQSMMWYHKYGYERNKIIGMYDSVKQVLGANQWPILQMALRFDNMELARHVYKYLMEHTHGPIIHSLNETVAIRNLDTIEKVEMVINVEARSHQRTLLSIPRPFQSKAMFSRDCKTILYTSIVNYSIMSAWRHNNIELARWVVNRLRGYIEKYKIVLAVETDSLKENTLLEMVQFIYESGIRRTWNDILRKATVLGRVDVLEYLLPRVPTHHLYLIDYAAGEGNLDMIHTILRLRPTETILNAFAKACMGGSVPIFRFLVERFPNAAVGNMILNQSLIAGHIDMANYILDHVPCPPTKPTKYFVVNSMHDDLLTIDLLDTLLGNKKVDCQFSTVYSAAVRKGLTAVVSHLDVSMHNFDKVNFDNALQHATRANDLAMVQSILVHHGDYPKYTNLALAVQPECSSEIVRAIASSDIMFNKTSHSISPSDLRTLSENQYYNTIKILHEYGRVKKFSELTFEQSCTSNSIEIVQLLHTIPGIRASYRTWDNTVSRGHIRVMDFLLENRTEGCYNAVVLACESGRIEMVEWLMTNAKKLIAITQPGNSKLVASLERQEITLSQLDYFLRTRPKSLMDPVNFNRLAEIESADGSPIPQYQPEKYQGELIKAALRCNNSNAFEMVKYLHEKHGQQILKTDTSGIITNKGTTLETIKYLVDNNMLVPDFDLNRNTIERVVRMSNSADLIRYLLGIFHRIPPMVTVKGKALNNMSITNAINTAINSNRWEIAQMSIQFFDARHYFTADNLRIFYHNSIKLGNLPLILYLSKKQQTHSKNNYIFKIFTLRRKICNYINDISTAEQQREKEKIYIKGRDIIKLWDIRMLSKYALPWHFVKHYLPNDCKEINEYIRYQAINKYAAHPNATVDTLQHLIEWSPDVYFVGDYLDKTAINGKIDILKMIHQRYPNTILHTSKSVEIAAWNSHLSVIQLLHSIDNQGIPIFTTHVMDNAAKVGNLSIIQWLHQNRSEGCSEKGIDWASENGHFECVKYLVENTNQEGTEDAMDMAASNGHYDIVCYLHQQGYMCTTNAMDGAAKNGHLIVLKFLQENRNEGYSFNAHYLASKNGHLSCVMYLDHHGGEDYFSFQVACENGHILVVEYLHRNKYRKWSFRTLKQATKNGHLSTVQYLVLYNKKNEFNESLIDIAAEFGHLKVIEFLHTHEIFKCSTKAMDKAAAGGHLDVLQFLYFNRTEGYSNEIAELAAINGHLDVLIWIHNTLVNNNELHLFTQRVMDLGVRSNNINVVKWLHKNQTHYSFSRDIIDDACTMGQLDIVQYLFENTTIGCSGNAIIQATKNGHLEIVQYLLTNQAIQNLDAFLYTLLFKASLDHPMISLYLYNYNNNNNKNFPNSNLDIGMGFKADRLTLDHLQDFSISCYMLERSGAGCDYSAIQNIYLGHPTMLSYLYNKGVDISKFLIDAVKYGHLTIIKFLVEKYPDLKKEESAIEHACSKSHENNIKSLEVMDNLESYEDAINNTNNNNNTTTTTTTVTTNVNRFIDVFRSSILRDQIFKSITLLSQYQEYIKDVYERDQKLKHKRYIKGRDIIKLWDIGMLSKYALPWHFVKHYLPNDCKEINRYIRYQAINEYAAHPNATVDTLQHLIEWSPDVYFVGDYIDGTAVNGKIDILTMLHQRYPNTIIHTNKSVEGAATKGHMSVIQFLHSIDNQGIPIFTTEVMDNAAEAGHLALVQWLHQNRSEGSTERAINLSSKGGHFECVKFLVENTKEKGTEEAMNLACFDGHYEVIKYLHQHDYLCTTNAMDWAALGGHYYVIKFLHENRTEGCTQKAINLAAKFGYLDCIKYLTMNRSEGCTTDAMNMAAKKGHLSVVEYLHFNRTEGCTQQAMDNASRKGHLSVVEFLHRNRTEGCSEDAMNGAAANGHLQVVEFLKENRSEWCTKASKDGAAKNGHLNILQYLVAHMGHTHSAKIANLAAAFGHLDVLIWIHTHLEPISSHRLFGKRTMDKAAVNGHISVVQWLHRNRTEGCTKEAIDGASLYGHISVVEFLHFNRSEGCTATAFTRAASNNHLSVVQFLQTHKPEKYSKSVMDQATIGGHAQVSQYLLEHGSADRFTSESIYYSATHGQLQQLEKLILASPNQQASCVKGMLLYFASVKGRYFTMAYLHSLPASMFTEPDDLSLLGGAFNQAGSYCRLSTLDFLLKNGYVNNTIPSPYCYQSLSIAYYLKQQNRVGSAAAESAENDHDGGGHDGSIIDYCASNGHLTSMSYLLTTGETFTSRASIWAARAGFLSVLKFLKRNGKLGLEESMDGACSYDHLSCMIFLDQNCEKDQPSGGCTELGINEAASIGSLSALKWIYHNRPDELILNRNGEAIKNAAYFGQLSILQFLLTVHQERQILYVHGNSTPIDQASKRGHLTLVQYLHSQNQPATINAINDAANEGELTILQFLTANRTEGASTHALDRASESGRLSIVRFLIENRSERCTNWGKRKALEKDHTEIYDILNVIIPVDIDYSDETSSEESYHGNYSIDNISEEVEDDEDDEEITNGEYPNQSEEEDEEDEEEYEE